MKSGSIKSFQNNCLSEVLSRHPVVLAYIYGSVAVEKATSSSDIDLALVVEEDAISSDVRLKFELQIEEEIARKCEIGNADVRVINDAPLIIKGEVVTTGRLIFCRNEEARVAFETQTRMAYFDFLPVHAMIQDAYFKQIEEHGFYGKSR